MSWETTCSVTDKQVQFYSNHGYLLYGRIFSEPELDALRDYVDRLIATLPEGSRPESLDVPHFEHPFLFTYLTHPRVLDVIEQFIGPDIVLWSSHVISKRSNDGLAVPWHQDGIYWGKRLQPMTVITMWLAVDESCIDNGCMRVVSDSHHSRGLRYEEIREEGYLFGREAVSDQVNEDAIVNLELKVGECHFHDGFTLHASNSNTSTRRRCGYTMRYFPADVRHFEPPDRDRPHHIYLVRGQDRTAGHNQYAPIPTVQENAL